MYACGQANFQFLEEQRGELRSALERLRLADVIEAMEASDAAATSHSLRLASRDLGVHPQEVLARLRNNAELQARLVEVRARTALSACILPSATLLEMALCDRSRQLCKLHDCYIQSYHWFQVYIFPNFNPSFTTSLPVSKTFHTTWQGAQWGVIICYLPVFFICWFDRIMLPQTLILLKLPHRCCYRHR